MILITNYQNFVNIKYTSQVVINDLTNEQQRRLTNIMIAQRKQKRCQLAYEKRGRRLKANIFPDLKIVLEAIVSHCSSGMVGGLESHPRLTTDVMYRTKDNNLYMRQARDYLLKCAPPGFGISLKSCYNYTESYKETLILLNATMLGQDVNARNFVKVSTKNWSIKASCES
jgi:hypothetical protein